VKKPSRLDLNRWRALELLTEEQGILDWIPRLSPNYMAPVHLRPLLRAIWEMQFRSVKAWCSIPPRFSKTESILHAIIHRLMLDPTAEIAYCTATANLAYSKSRKMRDLAQKAGLKIRKGGGGIAEWQLEQGGKVLVCGIGGTINGKGCNWLVIDDSLRNRAEAESVTIREKQWDWLTSTALTRVEPGGSVLINMTRWHDDDLIGRIQKEFPDWVGIHMPALFEDRGPEGDITYRSLWPERWSVEELQEKRRLVGEYDWASLFQGDPRPKGGRLFGTATRYTDSIVTEDRPYKIVIGADPAATAKTTADYSAAVVMAGVGNPRDLSWRCDVLEVWRGQVQIPEFVNRLRDLAIKWGAPVAVESVAGFKAVPQMLRNMDKTLKILEIPALGDKFTRSLGVSAAWNDGRVRVPHVSGSTTWVPDFLTEVEKFTGVKDAKDDQVDALAHAFNALRDLVPSLHRTTIEPIRNSLPFG